MSSDDLPELPPGAFQAKQEQLSLAVNNDKDKAWRLLQEDPIMILAFTKVKRDLEGNPDNNPIVEEFFDEYQQKVRLIFGEENPLERYGIALCAEFLTEYWRQAKNSVHLSSINEAILKKMALLMEASDNLPESDEQKIIQRIVDYSTKRIIDFSDYDRLKAKEHILIIKNELSILVENISEGDLVSTELLSFMYFATASTEAMEIFRKELAAVLLHRLRGMFEGLSEDDKFKIAPWLGVFERISSEE